VQWRSYTVDRRLLETACGKVLKVWSTGLQVSVSRSGGEVLFLSDWSPLSLAACTIGIVSLTDRLSLRAFSFFTPCPSFHCDFVPSDVSCSGGAGADIWSRDCNSPGGFERQCIVLNLTLGQNFLFYAQRRRL